MESKVLERILNDKDKKEDNIENLIDAVKGSKQYYIFEEILSNIKSKYFTDEELHDITHNERVTFLAMFLAEKENLSDTDLKLLLKAALYHDIGRVSAKGKEHGRESAKIIENNRKELAENLNDYEVNVLKFLCTIHSNPDDYYDQILKEYNLNESSELRKMTNILKDADALDRVRLKRFGIINPELLRMPQSKKLIESSERLLVRYKDVQREIFEENYTFGESIIEDDENYYIFRTLNQDNIQDLEDTSKKYIRTKGEVLRDKGEVTQYSEEDKISLEEVYSNVKIARNGKDNNCMSFSSNTNVSLDYDNNRYVMIKIPKEDDSTNVSAGRYMLKEVSNRIAEKIAEGNLEPNIKKMLSQIDTASNSREITVIVGNSIDLLQPKRDAQIKRYTGYENNIASKRSLISRFNRKQYLDRKQEVEYNKIVAKLTILELTGVLPSILPTQKTNANLLSAIGVAFSSSEYIHYGSLNKEDITELSRNQMEILAILQQAENIAGIDKKQIRELRIKTLNIMEEDKNSFKIDTIENREDTNEDISLEKAKKYLEINQSNIIPYYKGKLALEYIQNYANAKQKTQSAIEMLRENKELQSQIPYLSEILDEISKTVIIPNSKIIERKNTRGVKLIDSVNLDMNGNSNKTIFSNAEQKNIIDSLNKLSSNEIEQIANGKFDVLRERNIITKSLSSKIYLEGENAYYADYILDSIDLEKIYKVENVRDEKKSELRNKLENELKKVDVKRVYEAFLKIGVKDELIPNYILCLMLENGYGKYDSFESFIESENFEDIVSKNIDSLNNKITPIAVDNYLNIIDNNNIVQDSKIILRDYQQLAVDNVDKIFENKNFAGVVLPTGAGKSFVAMTEMLKHKKEEITYFAPQTEILNQVQKHILKNIVGKTILSSEDIDSMLNMNETERKDFLKGKVFNQNINIRNQLVALKRANTDTEKEQIKSKMYPSESDIMDNIHTVFPHLNMYCYQSLNGKKYENLLNSNSKLIIFDELHRTGAETWKPLIRNYIEEQPDAKILGITATPERDDAEHTDMMKYMAERYGGYSKEEIDSKEYLAAEMTLIDAMQDMLVVEPKLVSFNMFLDETEEYKYVVETIKEEKKKNPESELAKDLETIKAQMDSIINDGRKTKNKNIHGIEKVIAENIPEKFKNGRFIVFLPTNTDSKNSSSEEYVLQEIEKTKKYFEKVNPKINTGYLLSSRENKKENAKAILNFETSDSDEIKLLYAINMLNEGVHVDNINGELMLREIGSGSNILYFQQIGRVIYSIDQNNRPGKDDVPIIFDVHNNYLTRNLDKAANTTTTTSDLNNLQRITNWKQKHERFPDINSTDQDEARKAIALKKIQEKYERYLKGNINTNLSISEKKEIEKIIEIAIAINLFEEIIPERTIEPNEKDLSRVRTFEVKGEVKKFVDLFKETENIIRKAKKSDTKIRPSLKIRKNIEIFQTLSSFGLDLSDESFAKYYATINNSKVSSTEVDKKLNLYDIINTNFSDGTRDALIDELGMSKEELHDYKIYDEFDFTRNAFLDKKTKKSFEIYDIKDIRKSGILKKNGKFIKGITESGFVVEGPDIFKKINIYTATQYDENGYNLEGYNADGYNKEGYDKHGYDRQGFNKFTLENKYNFRKDGINIDTNSFLDKHGFDIDGYYWEIDENYPDDYTKRKNTYKKINEYGCNRDGEYYKEEADGKLIYIGTTDRYGFKSFEEISEYGFRRDGINVETNTNYDKHKFRMDKINIDTNEFTDKYGFLMDGYHSYTRKIVDKNNFDIDGFFYRKVCNDYIVENINTFSIYNDEGYDREGLDKFGVDKDGVKHFSVEPDERGFNEKGINIHTGTILDENGLDIDGFYCEIKDGVLIKTEKTFGKNGLNKDGVDQRLFNTKTRKNVLTDSYVDENGFDIDGYYWKKDENGVYYNTGLRYDEEGYNYQRVDKHGFNKEHLIWNADKKQFKERNKYGFNYLGRYKDNSLYDSHGFDIDGIHEITHEKVNEDHFDIDTYYCVKNSKGEWQSTGKKYDQYGFDIDGGYHEVLENKGKDGSVTRKSKSSGYMDEQGFNAIGINKFRFNRQGLYVNLDGSTQKLSPRGFDSSFNYWKKGKDGKYYNTGEKYDDDGYDIDGLDRENFDKKGLYKHKHEYNNYGFNVNHRYKKNLEFYDNYGFDYRGIHKDTQQVFDTHNFDRDGFFYEYEEESQEYIKTDRKVDSKNFDRDGFFYEYYKDRHDCKKTEYKTDPYGVDIDGVFHEEEVRDVATKRKIKQEKVAKIREKKKILEEISRQEREEKAKKRDEERAVGIAIRKRFEAKFDENKICISTNLKYDENKFDYSGYNIVTGTSRDVRGFDCLGRCKFNFESIYDKNGFKQDGTYLETNEKFAPSGPNAGYNAYGVTREGKNKFGSISGDIRTAQEFIQANFKSKNQADISKFIRKYCQQNRISSVDAALKKIKQTLYIATEMYEPIKTELEAEIKNARRQILISEAKLRKLREDESANKELIEKYTKFNQVYMDRIKRSSFDIGEK